MKTSDRFIEALHAEGVQYIFGVPGEENLDLLDSIRESPIEMVLNRHEQAAGFMAATVGRLTGRPGVCMATLGPGATNLMTAAAYAQLGGMPMLMITGQKPLRSNEQGSFQLVDVTGMMAPLTKYTHVLVSGDSVSTQVREAFRVAQEERPGAVHLELPEDVAQEPCSLPLAPEARTRRPIAEQKSIDRAVKLIECSARPLLLVGMAANRKLTSKMLHQLVDKTGIPLVSTQMGKGVVDERHPRFIGNAALSSGDLVHRAFDEADLIVNVGHDPVEKPPFVMRAGGKPVVHVNFCSAQVNPVYFPQLEVVGDIANSLWQLQQRLGSGAGWDFSAILEVKEAIAADIESGQDDDRFPLHPSRLVADVRRAMPSEGIIALDNGLYKLWFARNYPAHAPNTVLLDNALASMGAGLPSAMAARMVHPDRPVMAICGDGGFMMNSQELEVAQRHGLDLVVLVLRDDAYGMIEWKQRGMGLAQHGLRFGNPDFVRYAEAYGARGHRVANAGGFLPTLRRCLSTPGVDLIDVPIDYPKRGGAFSHEPS